MAPTQDTPTALVMQMRQQGMSNNQIVLTLQREGYAQTQIYDALNQADAKGAIEPYPANMMQAQNTNDPMSGLVMQPGGPIPNEYQQSGAGSAGYEELIESIIEEKWNDLTLDINKVIKWKDYMEDRMAKQEQKFNDLKGSFDMLHQAVVGKIGEYDKHILDVGSEVQAMEKVFQKVLPAFAENVNELSRITKNIKNQK